MPAKKEFWKMLLLLSSATRCNRAGAVMQSRGSGVFFIIVSAKEIKNLIDTKKFDNK